MSSKASLYNTAQPLRGQIIELNRSWAAGIAANYPLLFPTTAKAQTPKILFLGCCDSRVPETQIMGLLPGEVFVHRNIGNIINPVDGSWQAALLFAVEEAKVQHIIVCGHIGCGACQKVVTDTPTEIDGWLAPLITLRNIYRATIAKEVNPANQWARLITLNVQHNLDTLSKDPTLIDRIKQGKLNIHGAIYDINNGHINFLEGDAEKLPTPDPVRPIQKGFIKSQDIKSGALTSFKHTVSFSKPYSTPPRIFLGIFGTELSYGSRIQFHGDSQNVTNTGFDVVVGSEGDTKFIQSSFTWLEIPDELTYADFQTGVCSIKASCDAQAINQQLFEKITFAKPYNSPPNIVAVPIGFDIDVGATFKVFASQITATGFLVNIEILSGKQLGGGSVSWLAYPADKPTNVFSGVIGNTDPTTQYWLKKGTINSPGPAVASEPFCTGIMCINQFAVAPSNHMTMFSVFDFDHFTATGGTYTMGKWAGALTQIDATYIGLSPTPLAQTAPPTRVPGAVSAEATPVVVHLNQQMR